MGNLAIKKLLFFLLLNIVIGTQVQCSNNLQKKWEHWEQHPIYSFFQIVADSTSSMPDIMTLKTKGYMKGILGKSYPVFHLDKDSLTIDVRMKYKTQRCKSLLLTFYAIGEKANVMGADTIVLPLEEDWTEHAFSLSIKKGFSIEVSIEAEGSEKEKTGDVSIAYLDISSDGSSLDNLANAYRSPKISPSSVKTWEDLLSSSIMDKKILALGETVHGTRTLNDIGFELMKERILRHHCKLIVFETPLSVALYLNRYVKNDQRYSYENIQKFVEPFSTIGIGPFLHWLKEYNAIHNNEITLLGVDGEAYSILGKMNLYNYLDCANSDGLLDPLCDDLMYHVDSANVDTIVTKKLLSDKETKLLQCCINNMREYQTSRQSLVHRDEKMAEMMQILDSMYLDSNITATFYGHFMHANYVMTSSVSFIHNSPSMGCLLKQKYGADYACIALSAKQGDAWYNTIKNERELHPIQKAPDGSIENAISSVEDGAISYLPMDKFSYHDVFLIRNASAIYGSNEFSYWPSKACMDGIVNVNKASHWEGTYEPFEKRENFLHDSWFKTLVKLREKRTK